MHCIAEAAVWVWHLGNPIDDASIRELQSTRDEA